MPLALSWFVTSEKKFSLFQTFSSWRETSKSVLFGFFGTSKFLPLKVFFLNLFIRFLKNQKNTQSDQNTN